jgi:hypothetical protein
MSIVTDTQLRMAEIYALDLAADTNHHLQLLKQLRDELALKVATGQGAHSVARERFEAATQTTETLLRQMDAHRELLRDLRATLAELRKTISEGSRTDDGRRRPLPES